MGRKVSRSWSRILPRFASLLKIVAFGDRVRAMHVFEDFGGALSLHISPVPLMFLDGVP